MVCVRVCVCVCVCVCLCVFTCDGGCRLQRAMRGKCVGARRCAVCVTRRRRRRRRCRRRRRRSIERTSWLAPGVCVCVCVLLY